MLRASGRNFHRVQDKDLNEAVQQLIQFSVPYDSDTYASVLRKCGNAKALQQGKSLHAHMIFKGYDEDIFLSNVIIQMYGNCGSIEDARVAFQKMNQPNIYSWNIFIGVHTMSGYVEDARLLFNEAPLKNVVTWNTMFAAYSKNGWMDDAKEIFDRMPQRNVVSINAMLQMHAQNGHFVNVKKTFDVILQRDVLSWTITMAAYVHQNHLVAARSMFDKIPTRNVVCWNIMMQTYAQETNLLEARNFFDIIPEPSTVSWNIMIQAYIKAGQLENARNIFDGMAFGDVCTWNSMIIGYAQAGRLRDAKTLFDGMTNRSVLTWNSMISACTESGHLRQAKSLFDVMSQRDMVSWNCTLTAYAQNGDLHTAKNFFDRMCQWCLVAHNGMMQAYVENGQIEDAKKLFDQAPQRNVSSWNILLQAYGMKDGELLHAKQLFSKMAEHDLIAWTAMVTACAQNERVKEARDMFDSMPRRDTIAFNVMISAYVQAEQNKEAMELFRLMDHRPNEATYVGVLEACASIAALTEGKMIHNNLIYIGLQSHLRIGTTLVNLYGKCGRLEEAKRAFDEIIETDIISWNALIAAYAHNGYGKESLKLFQAMELEGIKPNSSTLVSIITACSHAGLFIDGLEYLVSFTTDYNVHLKEEHYACGIDLLGRIGKLPEAEALLKSMPVPDLAMWMTLLGGCSKHNDLVGATRAAQQVFELDPGNAAAFVMADAGPSSTSGKKSKKRKRHVELKVDVVDTEEGKLGPIMTYFPTPFDPSVAQVDGEVPEAEVYRNSEQYKTGQVQLVVRTNSSVDFVGGNTLGESATWQPTVFALGIFDKEEGTLKVVPVIGNKVLRMEPRVRGIPYKSEDGEEVLPEADYFQGKKMLLNRFGTKRSKMKNKKYEKGIVTEEALGGTTDAFKDYMQAAAKKEGLQTKEEVIEAANLSLVRKIPPYDVTATKADNAYPLNQIIPPEEWAVLEVEELFKASKSAAFAQTLKQNKTYSEYILNRLNRIRVERDKDGNDKRAHILAYLKHLLSLYHSASTRFPKDKNPQYDTRVEMTIPPVIMDKLRRLFTVEQPEQADRRAKRTLSKDYLISYILVLGLKVDGYEVDPYDTAVELKMTVSTLEAHYLQLGCKIQAQRGKKLDLTSTRTRIMLPVPLQLTKLSEKPAGGGRGRR